MAEKPEPVLQDLDDSPDDDIEVPGQNTGPVVSDLGDYAPPVDTGEDIEIEIVKPTQKVPKPPPVADDADTDHPAPDEDADDSDLDDLPTKFRKRLEREIKAKHNARKETNAERAARIEAEKKLAEYERKGIDSDIASAEADYAAARTAGNVEDETKAVSKLTGLRAKKAVLEAQPAQPAQQQPRRSDNDALSAWKRRHASWFDKPGFDIQSDAAVEIGRELEEEGWDNADSGFYEEVDRRLAKVVRLPKVERPSSPVAPARDTPASAGAVRTQAGKTRVTLDEGDFAMMRTLRMDPNNKDHVLAYAREKARRPA